MVDNNSFFSAIRPTYNNKNNQLSTKTDRDRKNSHAPGNTNLVLPRWDWGQPAKDLLFETTQPSSYEKSHHDTKTEEN
jgi:hypothetical protein